MKLDSIKKGDRLFLDDFRTILETENFSFFVEKVRKFSFENGSELTLCYLENEMFKLILAQKKLGDLVDYKVYNYMEFFVEGSREDHLVSNPWIFGDNGRGFSEVIESDNGVYVRKKLPEVTHDGEYDCFIAEYETQADLENNELIVIETGAGWIEFYEGRIISENDFKTSEIDFL